MTEEQFKPLGETEKVTEAPKEAPISEVKPPAEPKKKLWIVIVAVIIAIALIATALYVLVARPSAEEISLEGWILPSSVTIAQGEKARIFAYASFMNGSEETNVSDNLMITWSWINVTGLIKVGNISEGVTEESLRYIDVEDTTEGVGAINASMQYMDPNTLEIYRTYAIANITVGPPVLSYVEIIPAEFFNLINTSQEFTAIAYLTDDTKAVGASYSWSLTGDDIGDISNTTGNITLFTAGNVSGNATLSCTATLDLDNITGSADITIIKDYPPAKSTTKVYDIFNVPFQEYWFNRSDEEKVIHSTFPYVEVWMGVGANNYTYSTTRMNVTARNISGVNSTNAPWYVPVLSPTVRGGNIELNWEATYLTWAETNELYSEYLTNMFDGWYFRWTGTITMDRTAAKMVTGMTDAEFNDFDDWKQFKFGDFQTAWSDFLAYEAATHWNIYYCYYYMWNPMDENYSIEKVGDEIIFHIDHLSWGAESLLGRWFRETFVEYEYWPENITFNARISPLWSDFDLQMDAMYYPYHMDSIVDGSPSWTWENMHADEYISPVGSEYKSELNYYYELDPVPEYFIASPGSALYSTWTEWDYVPWGWNLPTENDTLTFEWPSSDQIIGYIDSGIIGDYTNNITGYVQPRWIEPVPGEVPNNVDIDFANRTITLRGPFDAFAWSQNTWASRSIIENRSDTGGLLCRGVPFIEFVVVEENLPKPIAILASPDIFGLRLNYDIEESSTWHDWTYLTRVNTTISLNGTASWDLDGSLTNYTWDLGDGNVSWGETITHNYTQLGSYTIQLNVTDNASLTSNDTLRISVVSNIPPVAAITGPHLGDVDENLSFSGSLSKDWDGSIANYSWDLGDGNVSYGENIMHAFGAQDLYTITLTVTDNEGGVGTAVHRVTTMSPAPIAKIITHSNGIVGMDETIDGSMSMSPVPGRSIVNWSWEFGDGTSGFGEVVTHNWSSAGTYDVNLNVTDSASNVSDPTTAQITITSAGIAGIGVSLARHALLLSESTDLTIEIVDSTGARVTDFTGTVDIECNVSTGVTVPTSHLFDSGDAGIYTFNGEVSFANEGSYRINATFGLFKGSEFATAANRTVEFRIYDIFQFPLQPFWDHRDVFYDGADAPHPDHYTAPVVHLYRANAMDPNEVGLYTTYRLNLEGRNLTEISLNNPTFVPKLWMWSDWIDEQPGVTGGHATYDVHYDYLTHDEYIDHYNAGLLNMGIILEDGWVVNVTGNLTMDREAAARLVGIPINWTEAEIYDWWDINIGAGTYFVYDAWIEWFNNESASQWSRLDIWASYDGYGMDNSITQWSKLPYDITVSGNTTITLSVHRINWGEDVTLMRQLFYGGENFGNSYPNWSLARGILPMECWYEDFNMTVDLWPSFANVSVDTGVTYGFAATKSDTAPAGTAAWYWEPILSDYDFVGVLGVKQSEMQPWWNTTAGGKPYTYTSWDPGSSAYSEQVDYDYVPCIWNMSVGEFLMVECPDGLVLGYLPQKLLGNWYLFNEMIEKWGYASMHVFGVPADEYIIDAGSGDVKIVGPFYPSIVWHPEDPTIYYEPAPIIEIWI